MVLSLRMDNLLAPLEELETLTKEVEKKVKKTETAIPIPNPAYLMKESKLAGTKNSQPLVKYQKEYEAFCRWSALPKDLRKPKTALEFERKNMLPKGYTQFFKQREDFRTTTITFFWEWMMDLYPDVVYAVYQQSVNAKNMKAAGIFIDLLSKKMNLDKPRVQVQPMVLMGVPQDKIDQLFVPKDYQEIIPGK